MKKFKSLLVVLLAIGLIMVTLVGCNKEQNGGTYDVGNVELATYRMKIQKNDDFEDYMGKVELVQGEQGSNRFYAGEEVTVKVEAYDGFAIQSAYLDNNNITSDLRKGKGSYTFRATRERTIKVNFVSEDELEYAYYIDLDGFKSYQGDVSIINGKEGYNEGDEITISVAAKKDCTLKSFSINGEDLTNQLVDGKYSMTVTQDADVQVEFDEDWTVIWYATVDNFYEHIDAAGKVLVDFYAPWCNPCINILAPQLDRLVPEGKIKIVKVTIQDINYNQYPEQQIFNQYVAELGAGGGIPFQILFQNGKLIKNREGATQGESGYREFLTWLGLN